MRWTRERSTRQQMDGTERDCDLCLMLSGVLKRNIISSHATHTQSSSSPRFQLFAGPAQSRSIQSSWRGVTNTGAVLYATKLDTHTHIHTQILQNVRHSSGQIVETNAHNKTKDNQRSLPSPLGYSLVNYYVSSTIPLFPVLSITVCVCVCVFEGVPTRQIVG